MNLIGNPARLFSGGRKYAAFADTVPAFALLPEDPFVSLEMIDYQEAVDGVSVEIRSDAELEVILCN